MVWGSADDFIDFDLPGTARLLDLIDQEVARVEAQCKECPDPDAFGLYDRMEELTGLGFVAAQQYITATYRRPGPRKKGERAEAIKLGPTHASGVAVAEAIDAAANYWKHHGEWPDARETATRAVLNRLFPSSDDYPLANLLFVLLQPGERRLAGLVPLMEAWRNALLARP